MEKEATVKDTTFSVDWSLLARNSWEKHVSAAHVESYTGIPGLPTTLKWSVHPLRGYSIDR